MPSPNATPTPITPPRVPLIDPRTNLIDRAWYMFFLSLQNAADAAYDNEDLKSSAESLIASYDAALQALTQNVDTQPASEVIASELAEVQKQIQALQLQPQFDVATITAAIAASYTAPVTKTADFTLASNETWVINNKSGSSCTVTLPTPSTNTGRVVHFQNYQSQTLISASSNVVPLAGGSATTAILEAVAGANATLVSDGANWIMTQYDSNNALQLE
jgi:hypothetical protein